MVLVTRGKELAITDVQIVVDRELREGPELNDAVPAGFGVGIDRSIGISVVQAVYVTTDAEFLARLISEAEFRTDRVDRLGHVRIDHAIIDRLHVRSHHPEPGTEDEGYHRREVHL